MAIWHPLCFMLRWSTSSCARETSRLGRINVSSSIRLRMSRIRMLFQTFVSVSSFSQSSFLYLILKYRYTHFFILNRVLEPCLLFGSKANSRQIWFLCGMSCMPETSAWSPGLCLLVGGETNEKCEKSHYGAVACVADSCILRWLTCSAAAQAMEPEMNFPYHNALWSTGKRVTANIFKNHTLIFTKAS